MNLSFFFFFYFFIVNVNALFRRFIAYPQLLKRDYRFDSVCLYSCRSLRWIIGNYPEMYFGRVIMVHHLWFKLMVLQSMGVVFADSGNIAN